jgi:hypothetical protein
VEVGREGDHQGLRELVAAAKAHLVVCDAQPAMQSERVAPPGSNPCREDGGEDAFRQQPQRRMAAPTTAAVLKHCHS